MSDKKVDTDYGDFGFNDYSHEKLERKMSKSMHMSRTLEEHPEYSDIEKDMIDINKEEAKQLQIPKSTH